MRNDEEGETRRGECRSAGSRPLEWRQWKLLSVVEFTTALARRYSFLRVRKQRETMCVQPVVEVDKYKRENGMSKAKSLCVHLISEDSQIALYESFYFKKLLLISLEAHESVYFLFYVYTEAKNLSESSKCVIKIHRIIRFLE